MASYTVATSKHATLTANTVDTATLSANWSYVEVLNRSASGYLFFTTNGDTPTVGGDGTGVVGPGGAVKVFTPEPTATVVKLISASADAYSVTGS